MLLSCATVWIQSPLAIPAKAEELRAAVGPEKYEAVVIEAIQNVGRKSLPSDATMFLESINLASLRAN